MRKPATFSDIVEAADNLPLDEQEALLGILQRRMTERRRAQIAREIQEADLEFQRGECQPASPDELLREIES